MLEDLVTEGSRMPWRSDTRSDARPEKDLQLVKQFLIFPSALLGSTVIISERKRGLELRGDKFRCGLVGRENMVVLEFLDKGGSCKAR